MINKRKRVISLILSVILCVVAVSAYLPEKEVSAASKYIKVEDFIKYAVEKLRLGVDRHSKTPYIDAAIKAGILKKGDFKKYTLYLTRTDCAVIANRVDRYVNGEYFGYAKEVYEFLKGCNYKDGIFYYNVKGDLYPEGVNSITYEAAEFLNNVVEPIITPYFKFERDLGAWYENVYDSKGNELEEYIMIGLKPATGIYPDPLKENDYLIMAWKKIVDGERKFKATYDKRISDLSKITKSKRRDVAEVVAKGIIKGYSNGKYVQNRSFKGSGKITVSGAKNVIDLAIDKDNRAPISPDGQLIRRTNLPKNAAEYPYILECFPNEFYEMVYEFQRLLPYQNGTMLRSEYSFPRETGNADIEYYKNRYITVDMEPYQYYDTIIEKVEKHLSCIFNVDYRTVNQKWVNEVSNTYVNGYEKAIQERIRKYLNNMKINQVIVESKVISVEPSSLYKCYGYYYVRAYVMYRVSAASIKVEDDYELLLGSMSGTYLVGLKNTEWRYGYYDIEVSSIIDDSNQHIDLGVNYNAGISDEPLRGSK